MDGWGESQVQTKKSARIKGGERLLTSTDWIMMKASVEDEDGIDICCWKMQRM
jgi:hypothetical protein